MLPTERQLLLDGYVPESAEFPRRRRRRRRATNQLCPVQYLVRRSSTALLMLL